jgi:hypothetical protein
VIQQDLPVWNDGSVTVETGVGRLLMYISILRILLYSSDKYYSYYSNKNIILDSSGFVSYHSPYTRTLSSPFSCLGYTIHQCWSFWLFFVVFLSRLAFYYPILLLFFPSVFPQSDRPCMSERGPRTTTYCTSPFRANVIYQQRVQTTQSIQQSF